MLELVFSGQDSFILQLQSYVCVLYGLNTFKLCEESMDDILCSLFVLRKYISIKVHIFLFIIFLLNLIPESYMESFF